MILVILVSTQYIIAAVTVFLYWLCVFGQITKLRSSVLTSFNRFGIKTKSIHGSILETKHYTN